MVKYVVAFLAVKSMEIWDAGLHSIWSLPFTCSFNFANNRQPSNNNEPFNFFFFPVFYRTLQTECVNWIYYMHPHTKFRSSLSLSLMDFTFLLITQARAWEISPQTRSQSKNLGARQPSFAITVRRWPVRICLHFLNSRETKAGAVN